ncbi:UDP-N-acetylmuramoyl-L-alanine--D-glutamate ligase [Candidatus Pantoea edessiphila]|uniref:UDP-N-acetylmuramoylalanine--D-glutamate ligase n=1 Tax=Candidatus Pantoea edessiphila TaxID=2044610 RepID=A0A2P5SWF2_9GAMM|nr:UDP-N-acetylmuramoyl-L-alanine--D-glutamate ligase [Candidatus Pantoea edessiphila]PPI86641.1 UDP-N-acetylmuramoyl-L-alanine--D-glutamate ligase [Candidatus Pantoea edessiphila]
MIEYKGKKVVIIGLGLTGLSCVKFFLKKGVIPRVIDTRLCPPQLKQLPKNVEFHLGEFNTDWLFQADLIITSPGIDLSCQELQQALNKGIEILGDIELFCRELTVPIIAITGSNGKSTVTVLIKEMAKAAGYQVGVGGNIGFPVLDLLNEPIKQLYILEVSSFQLEVTNSLRANVATILNVSENHLNRYPLGINQYRNVKMRIYQNALIYVINKDDPSIIPENSNNQNSISFGINKGDYHLVNNKDEIYIKNIYYDQNFNIENIKITGQHNYINILAALALAGAIGLPYNSSLETLCSFKGLKHRFQLITEHKGIKWINDSKSTNIKSTEAALFSLNSSLKFKGTIWLLLGGDGKNADFSSLRRYVINKNIRFFCFGKDGKKIASMNPEISTYTKTMQQAVMQIASLVKTNDTVLLSPACASLDQFDNFEHRGNIFIKLVKKIINE